MSPISIEYCRLTPATSEPFPIGNRRDATFQVGCFGGTDRLQSLHRHPYQLDEVPKRERWFQKWQKDLNGAIEDNKSHSSNVTRYLSPSRRMSS
ncbi:unnamed protein product [Phytophthora lilii]|uniref:Unnamed protein product n=1 Tax=Phytophthora lilii TaxID=2077276 RepID=A0A9W6YJY3_9STRA|nr:unnamed protein product [Phytophthora lilii]